MRRHLFTLLSAMSLVLCLSSIGLRAWEHFAYAGGGLLYVTDGGRGVSLDTGSGGVVAVGYHTGHPGRGFSGYFLQFGGGRWPDQPPEEAVLGGFHVARSVLGDPNPRPPGAAWVASRVEVPTWFITLVAAAMPAVWVHRRLARRRFRVGFCPVCGYDLRASPGRCPECGAEPKGATA